MKNEMNELKELEKEGKFVCCMGSFLVKTGGLVVNSSLWCEGRFLKFLQSEIANVILFVV